MPTHTDFVYLALNKNSEFILQYYDAVQKTCSDKDMFVESSRLNLIISQC